MCYLKVLSYNMYIVWCDETCRTEPNVQQMLDLYNVELACAHGVNNR